MKRTDLPHAEPFWTALDALMQGGQQNKTSVRNSYARSVVASMHVLRDELKVRILRPDSLGGRHILKLVDHWKTKGVSDGTLLVRIYALRWLCDLIGKPGMVPSNKQLGITVPAPAQGVGAVAAPVDFNQTVFVKAFREDATLAYVLWLQHATGCSRERALRARGSDIKTVAWNADSRPGKQSTKLTIPPEHQAMVPAVIKHIIEQHKKVDASLGWSGRYSRSDCHSIDRDLRRIKYLIKKLGLVAWSTGIDSTIVS